MYNLGVSSTAPISGNEDIWILNTATRTPRAVTKVRIQFPPAKECRASSPGREGTQFTGLSTWMLYPTELLNYLNNQRIQNIKWIG